MKLKVVFLITICNLMLSSCWKPDDFEEFRIEPTQHTWVFPVVNSTLCFKEIVERNGDNTLVDVMPGSSLYFMSFRDTINAGSAADMFQLQSKAFNVVVPVNLPAGVNQINIPLSETFEAIAGVELKSVIFSSGRFRIWIRNSLNYQISGQIVFSSLVSGVTPLTQTFTNLGIGSTIDREYQLGAYKLDLYKETPVSYNSFNFNTSITVASGGNSTTGNIELVFEFISPDFEILVGKFNQTISTGNQETQIAVFNNTVLATQHFAQPTMEYTIANSFGVPIKFRYSKFEVENNAGTITQVTNDVIPTASDMNMTGYNILNYVENPSILTPALTSFTLGYLNSNVEEIFDDAPNKLSYISEVTLGDETDSHDYFVKKTSQIQFFSDITVPLSGWATTHLLSDTLESIDFPELTEMGITDTLDYSLSLKIKFSNELPINMDFQVEFLDDASQIIEELFEENDEPLILSPEIDTNGESIGVKAGYATITVSKEKYNTLKDASKLVLLYKLSSGGAQNQVVRVLSTNKITIEMSVIATATLDFQSM